MEVHNHTHTARKKWTHYLWEFLMLFLAVFCGFLAENIREHSVERKREKEYISSIIKDLEYDTLQFNYYLAGFQRKLPLFDSVFLFLNNPGSFNNKLPYSVWGKTDLLSVYTPAEPAIQQLKNSGNLRLIGNNKVLDSILIYDSHINGAYLNQSNYVVEFHKRLIAVKEFFFDETNFNRFIDDFNQDKVDNESDYSLALYETDKVKIKELINTYIELKASDVFYIYTLKARKKEAENLLVFIKKEYSLK